MKEYLEGIYEELDELQETDFMQSDENKKWINLIGEVMGLIDNLIDDAE